MGTQGVVGTADGLGLYGAFVDPDRNVRLVDVGTKDDGRWLPLGVVLGLQGVGEQQSQLTVQAPLSARGRKHAEERIKFELDNRSRDVQAPFDGQVAQPRFPWAVRTLKSRQTPKVHLREFGFSRARLLSGPLPYGTVSLAFDRSTILKALQLRQARIHQVESDLELACTMREGDIAAMMNALLDPTIDGITILEVHG